MRQRLYGGVRGSFCKGTLYSIINKKYRVAGYILCKFTKEHNQKELIFDAFIIAMRHDASYFAKYLFSKFEIDVNAKNNFGYSMLDIAVINKNRVIIKYLLEKQDIDLSTLTISDVRQIDSITAPFSYVPDECKIKLNAVRIAQQQSFILDISKRVSEKLLSRLQSVYH